MNNVYARNKKKRTRSSSSEGKNSFVQNVTARVTGFLPTTITKWFSSPTTAPSSGNSNGSTTAGYTDSSSDDETSDRTSVEAHPPVKRMRFSTNISPVPAPAYIQSQGESTLSKWSNQPVNPDTMLLSTPDAHALKRGSIFSSTAIKPTPEVKIEANPSSGDNEYNTTVRSSHTLTRTGPSLLQRKRKSLFDNVSVENTPETQQAKSVSDTSKAVRSNSSPYPEPMFRASLLGSPFYAGRTMYGGASTTQYLNEPNIRQHSQAVVNESKVTADTLSGPARRVMDILESYSSPYSEGRRIPPYMRSPNTAHSSNYVSPKTSISQLQSIQVPSVGTFLNIKKRSRLMDSTSAARQILASHSSSVLPYAHSSKRNKVDNTASTSSGSSVKSRLKTTSKQSDRWQEELPPPVDLPSATLNMDQAELPKFSFGVSPAPAKTVQPALADNTPKPLSGTPKLNPVHMEVTAQDELVINCTFKFSSPIRISNDFTANIVTPPSVAPSFDKVTLLSPIEKTEKLSVRKDIMKDESKEWRCGDCWVNNKANVDKCVCCGSKKPSAGAGNKPAKCTKCKTLECEANSEICVACKKIDVAIAQNATAKKVTTSTWKCDSCWVSNNMSDDKCVCCAGKRPLEKSSASSADAADLRGTASSSATTSLTSVPSSTATANSTLPKSDSFKPIIIGSQSNQWECPSCLVRNDKIKLKCVCCETDKPGSVKESDKKLFNFGVSNTGFKFGIQSQAKEDKPTASENTSKFQINNKETETNNNSLKTAPAFSFGIPSGGGSDNAAQKNKENKPSPAAKVDTLSNKGFTLGNNTDFFKIPLAKASSTPNTAQKENEVNKKDTEKEQEVPKAFAPIKLGPQTLTPSSYFGSFANKQGSEKEVPISSAPSVDKATTNTSTAAGSVMEPNKPLFTFPTANAEQRKTNRITPVTTSTVTHSTLLATPATTAAPMFSASATSSPAAMFPTPEPTTTQPTTSAVFSFGSNKPAQPTTDNNAKFNFSFGTGFAPTFKANNDTTNSNALVPLQAASANTLASGTSLVPNSTPATNNIFGSPAPAATESIWGSPAPATAQPVATNVSSIFSTSAPLNTLSKPAFNFGSTPFKVSNAAPTPIFSNNNNTLNPPAFGAPITTNNATPTFGNPIKPANNLPTTFGAPQLGINSSPFGNTQNKNDMFGIQTQQMTNQPSLFMNKEASSSPFGGGAKAAGAGGIFGAAAMPAAAPPALDAAAAPNFNFTQPGMFSFNQQQQQQQQQPQHGVYSFGTTQNVSPQVQFNMGSPGNIAPAPNTAVRKVRKAVRRPR